MIQCVESRNEEHPYCSRVCCSEAVKNALEIKRRVPDANVAVLGRDIRTYGFRELYFQKAREEGVLFVRHPEKQRPGRGRGRRTARGDRPRRARATASWCCGPTCWCSRPASLRPADNPVLSGLLRSALTADGFFLEAHPKLRPVDLANEGEFLCGLAHSPRFIDETIAQAQAAVGRAATVLSKTHPRDPRPGGQGRSGELRGVRHVREGLPVRRAHDQRA